MSSTQVAAVLSILVWTQTIWAQEMAGEMHEAQTHVSCDDVPPGQKRPEFGCFNIATESGLQFQQSEVYWYIRTFANRTAAEAAKSATGIVAEEDGRVWLSLRSTARTRFMHTSSFILSDLQINVGG